MATRSYKIYAATTTSGSAIASIKVIRAGRITSINWALFGQCGASVDMRSTWELSKQSTTNVSVNDTPPTVLDYGCASANVASSAFGTNLLHAGMDQPVEAFDTLYLHALISGTAPIANVAICVITVVEK